MLAFGQVGSRSIFSAADVAAGVVGSLNEKAACLQAAAALFETGLCLRVLAKGGVVSDLSVVGDVRCVTHFCIS